MAGPTRGALAGGGARSTWEFSARRIPVAGALLMFALTARSGSRTAGFPPAAAAVALALLAFGWQEYRRWFAALGVGRDAGAGDGARTPCRDASANSGPFYDTSFPQPQHSQACDRVLPGQWQRNREDLRGARQLRP